MCLYFDPRNNLGQAALVASRSNNCRAGPGRVFIDETMGAENVPADRFGPKLISRLMGWPSREGGSASAASVSSPSSCSIHPRRAHPSFPSCLPLLYGRVPPLVRRANAAHPTILDEEESPGSGRDGRQGHRGLRLRRRKAAAFPHRRRPGRRSAALLAQEPVPLALLRAARRCRGGRPRRRRGGARRLAPCVAALLAGAGDHVLGALRPRTRLVKFSFFFFFPPVL
jgi:hypothetical protein